MIHITPQSPHQSSGTRLVRTRFPLRPCIDGRQMDPYTLGSRIQTSEICSIGLRRTLPMPQGATLVPHLTQNLALSRISEPHAGQVIACADATTADWALTACAVATGMALAVATGMALAVAIDVVLVAEVAPTLGLRALHTTLHRKKMAPITTNAPMPTPIMSAMVGDSSWNGPPPDQPLNPPESRLTNLPTLTLRHHPTRSRQDDAYASGNIRSASFGHRNSWWDNCRRPI